MKNKTGILLVNLGTPDSPKVADVRKYLKEFLLDERVIDINPIARNLLVRGIIAPFRAFSSAKIYKEVWTEEGSPLLVYGKKVKDLLQESLGEKYLVALGMRYQSPSIKSALNELKKANVSKIKVIPLFPQYASASTGSVFQKVMEITSKWLTIPPIEIVNSYHDNEKMIAVFAENAEKLKPETFDHILFSFHGLPVRQLVKSSDCNYCQKVENCCLKYHSKNQFCYSAQCHHTAQLIAKKLNIEKENYTICFQSRLGKTPWIEPFTIDVLEKLAQKGIKKVLVFSPAFVADCLETLYEITIEYQEEFKKFGGEKVQLVESLNTHPKWIETLFQLSINS